MRSESISQAAWLSADQRGALSRTVMQGDSGSEIDVWVDRARRMVDYRAEAMDFLRRVGSMLPAAGTDVELVCRLWAAADEYDVAICEAMRRFDGAIFDVPGQIEITRGAEPVATGDNGEGVVYLCTWTLVRSEVHSTSVALLADQVTGRLDFEVRDADGGRRLIGFPLRSPSDLYENLTRSFFTLHGVSVSE